MNNQTISAQSIFSPEFITQMEHLNFYGDVKVVFTGGEITNARIEQGFINKDRQGKSVKYQIILLNQE